MPKRKASGVTYMPISSRRRYAPYAAKTAVAAARGRKAGEGELKFHDVDHDDAGIAANFTLNTTSINLIAQGVTETTRIGRKCTIKNIQWRGSVQRGAQTAAANGGEVIRLMLVLDKQANGATPAVSGSGGVLQSDDYASYLNLTETGRYSVLYDKTFAMNATAGGGDGTTEDYATTRRPFSFFKRCSIPLEFDSTAGAITEIGRTIYSLWSARRPAANAHSTLKFVSASRTVRRMFQNEPHSSENTFSWKSGFL